MTNLKQERCEVCGELSRLVSIEIVRSGFLNSVIHVPVTWVCVKCGITFQTRIPYFEALYMGPPEIPSSEVEEIEPYKAKLC